MTDFLPILSDSAVFLLSPWKPLLIWGATVWWAWLVATKIQKDARYYQFSIEKWNIAFLLCAFAGLGLMIFGWMFYIGWPLGILVMFAPVLVYWKKRNSTVPAENRYTISLTRDPEKRQQKAAMKAMRDITLKYIASDNEPVAVPGEEDPARIIFQTLEAVLEPAMEQRASRVDLGLSSGGCIASMTVDTVRSKIDTFDTETGAKIFNLIRQMSGMDLKESRRQQIGEFRVSSPTMQHGVTATSSAIPKGQLLRLDFDKSQQVRLPFDGLGLLDQQRQILDAFVDLDNRNGLVLISAPAGQGLTTTGYALMSTHDSYTSNIRSLERRVEAELEGTVQQVWDPSDPEVDYPRMLQSMLRRDPDVIFIAGGDDAETAKIAAASGMDGPLLYLAMSASSNSECLTKWLQYIGDTSQAAQPLRAIVNQRLLRRLCDNCKVGYVPADTSRLRLPEGTELYRAGGQVQDRNKVIDCPVCRGGGYLGTTAIFEVVPISEESRMAIIKGDLKGAMTIARREKMVTLQEAAMRKAVSGETSIEEIGRVLSPKKKAAKPAPSQQGA